MTVTAKKNTLRERRHAATAEAMLEAAEHVMVAQGYELTTMQDIAREAGCAAGTFYLYFKNKQELFEALLVRHLQAIYAASEAKMALVTDPLEKIHQSMVSAVQYCQEHVGFLQVALTAMPLRHQAMHERLAGMGYSQPQQFRRMTEGYLRQAQKQGRVRRDIPVDVLYHFIDAAIFSFMETVSAAPGRPNAQKQADILWELITGGLQGKEAS
ncbi:MAG: helix-turn-helix domain containing protein [Planctomycetota bacterium]|nr:helix-turn-helix domain containing protein [Planctomycetota bacterium]